MESEGWAVGRQMEIEKRAVELQVNEEHNTVSDSLHSLPVSSLFRPTLKVYITNFNRSIGQHDGYLTCFKIAHNTQRPSALH